MEAQVVLLRAEFEAEEAEILRSVAQDHTRETRLEQDRMAMAKKRQSDIAE